MNEIMEGDCLDILPRYANDSVNLIMTSPPYAGKRGAVPAEEYVSWFVPRAAEFHRVLHPQGSFILNIKEGIVDGEREIYVLELLLALRKAGWVWIEEYNWHKTTSVPGKWPNRFRNAHEPCYHFTKQKQFYMNQDAVMVPIGDWSRSYTFKEKDSRRENLTGSGFGKNMSNWASRDKVYPTNVLQLAIECGNKKHNAVFPVALPTWFIRLFTRPGEVVLDPFVGSGTTAVAARQLGRRYLGIEKHPEFYAVARKRLGGELPIF